MSSRGKNPAPPEEHRTSLGDMLCQLTEGSEGAAHRDLSEGLDECSFVKPAHGPSKAPSYPTSPKRGTHWQSHHILSLICIANRRGVTEDDSIYLEKCLWITNWNVNEEPNMIGLPQNAWFRVSYGATVPLYKPANIPSHNTGHHAYLRDVEKWLYDFVWKNYNAKNAEGHDEGVTELRQALVDASNNWRGKLKAYGARNGGTIASWKNRHAGRPANLADRMAMFAFWQASTTATAPTWADKDASEVAGSVYAGGAKPELWYMPFSMAAVPKPRSPGRSADDLRGLFSSDHWK